MNDLKEIKQAVVTYGLNSSFVRKMVKTWASSIKSMLHNWLQLVSAVLGDRSQQMYKCYFWEEAKILAQQGKAKALETSQDQIQAQAIYDEQILSLSLIAALNAWDQMQELRN